MSFLSAEWRKLAIANYEIDPAILSDFLPNHTELDFFKGKCYVSLVGFMFINTKLLGFPIPFHINFEEVNLRFYVKQFSGGEWRRGVVFIKEIVPKPALMWVANGIYKEHYETMKMWHFWEEGESERTVSYTWEKNGKLHSFEVRAKLEPCKIAAGSKAEFITEHYWGFTKVNKYKTYAYQVTHPKWNCYEVLRHEIKIDFKDIYGKVFTDLSKVQPDSVMLAEGSAITVEHRKQQKSGRKQL